MLGGQRHSNGRLQGKMAHHNDLNTVAVEWSVGSFTRITNPDNALCDRKQTEREQIETKNTLYANQSRGETMNATSTSSGLG